MFLFCLVYAMSLCASVYMCFVVTCWERADLLALVCGVCCEFVTFPLVSWVRCGTWLYWFLIFAPLLTLVTRMELVKAMQMALLHCFQFEQFYKPMPGSRGGEDRGSRPLLKNHKNIGFLSNTGQDTWKITKLPNQLSMLGQHRQARDI